jgi:hypothetical protein
MGLTRFVIAIPDLIGGKQSRAVGIWRSARFFPFVTLNLFGVYTPETGKLVIPGESRGPCEAALCHLDPGFRRGTLTFRKGIIANLFQSLPRTRSGVPWSALE